MFVTLDAELARNVEGIVATASIDAVRQTAIPDRTVPLVYTPGSGT